MNQKGFVPIAYAIAILFIVVLLFPVKVKCGSPNGSCAIPPHKGESGARWYYTVEPLGIFLIEALTRFDIAIRYSDGITTD